MEADERQGRKMSRSYIHEERYVLVINGQRKVSYADQAAAMAEASRIRAAYPRVTIVVHDQQEDTVSALRGTSPTANPAPWPD
jgi:hypothetical protein